MHRFSRLDRQYLHSPHVQPSHGTPTRVPTSNRVAFAPRAATVPTTSWPNTSGSLASWRSPSMMWRSVRHTAHARTSSRTWPGPGTGSGTSRATSGARGRSRIIARTGRLYICRNAPRRGKTLDSAHTITAASIALERGIFPITASPMPRRMVHHIVNTSNRCNIASATGDVVETSKKWAGLAVIFVADVSVDGSEKNAMRAPATGWKIFGNAAFPATSKAAPNPIVASNNFPTTHRNRPAKNVATGTENNTASAKAVEAKLLPFSIWSGVNCGFLRIAVAICRANSASKTDCVIDFVPRYIAKTRIVTTIIGMNQFPFCLRAKTSLGAMKMSMKSSHTEGALGAAVAVMRISDLESWKGVRLRVGALHVYSVAPLTVRARGPC